MNIEDFYNQLANLSINAPTFEICELALKLQVAIDKLNHNEYDDLLELFG